MTSRTKIAVIVGVIGLLLATAVSLRVLIESDWDPTAFVAFGEDAGVTRIYGEERLGEIYLRANQGHDGKFFFVQANDPWVLSPEDNALSLDHPRYRSQRMLYPVIAGIGGLATPQMIVWGLLIVNLVAIGLGSFIVALVADEMGVSGWWGLSFALNLGTLSELTIDGGGILAMLFAFAAVLMLLRKRFNLAVFSLVLAGLSREVMLISAVGIAVWLWRRGRTHDAVVTAVAPLLAVGAWALYLRLRIGEVVGEPSVDALGWPFRGVIGAFGNWAMDPVDLAVGLGTILLMIFFLRRALTGWHLVGWAFIGFVPLAVLLSEAVWSGWFDISRAVVPILPAYLLLLFARSAQRQPATALTP